MHLEHRGVDSDLDWLRGVPSPSGSTGLKFRFEMAENTKRKKGEETPTSENTCMRYPRPFVKRGTPLAFDQHGKKVEGVEPPGPSQRISMRPSEMATADPRVTLRYHEPIKTSRQPSRAIAVPKSALSEEPSDDTWKHPFNLWCTK